MLNRVPLRLVWPSRQLLHRKMTKEKSKEDRKYYFVFMKISNATVTSKQNFIEKYHCLMKDLYNQNCSWKNEGNIGFIRTCFFTYNHNEFSLARLLLLDHILSCIFQPTLQVPFFWYPDSSSTDISPMDFSPKNFSPTYSSPKIFPRWSLPLGRVTRRTVPQTGNSPNRHFPDGQFPEWHFPERTFPRMDISPNHVFYFRNTKETDIN